MMMVRLWWPRTTMKRATMVAVVACFASWRVGSATATTAEEKLVGFCLDALLELSACGLAGGSSGCCLALTSLSERGCFGCGAAYEAMKVWAPDLDALVDGMLPSCTDVAFDARACPPVDYDDACGVESHVMRTDRLRRISTFVSLTEPVEDEAFSFSAIESGLEHLVTTDATLSMPG